jgi:hypothetical protein
VAHYFEGDSLGRSGALIWTGLMLNSLVMPILSLPRITKRLVVFWVDANLCVVTVWFAYYLRIGDWVSLRGDPMIAVLISLALALPILSLVVCIVLFFATLDGPHY